MTAQGPAHRDGQAGLDRLADQVMAEVQTAVPFDQQVGVEGFPHRVDQRGGRSSEELGQHVHGDRAAHGGGGLYDVAGRSGQQIEAAPDGGQQTDRHGFAREPRHIVGDRHRVLVPQAAEHLHQQQRQALRAAGDPQDLGIGRRAQDVLGDLRHRLVREGPEAQLVRAGLPQSVQCPAHQRGPGRAANGHQPKDRVRRQPGREGADSEQGQVVAPLKIVEDDEQRPVQGRPLQPVLQFLKQPEPLVGDRGELPHLRSVEQGFHAGQQSVQQRPERHEVFVGVRAPEERAEATPYRGGVPLRQKTGLAASRSALDAHDSAVAPGEGVESCVEERQFLVPAAYRRLCGPRVGKGPLRVPVHAPLS